MRPYTNSNSAPAPGFDGRDRRSKPRIDAPFLATVRGVDSDGREFEIKTALDNLSADGLHLRLMPCVELCSKLTVSFRFSTATGGPHEPLFAATGVVVRVNPQQGGACGVAVVFTRYEDLQ
jgi:hypothetical protein